MLGHLADRMPRRPAHIYLLQLLQAKSHQSHGLLCDVWQHVDECCHVDDKKLYHKSRLLWVPVASIPDSGVCKVLKLLHAAVTDC